MKEHIEQLIDYNYWANGLILKHAEKLAEEQFLESVMEGQNSLRDILAHVMLAEWFWLDRMQGRSRSLDEMRAFFNAEKYPDIKSLYDDWFDLELRLREFLAELAQEDLGEEFEYQRSDGTALKDSYADVFTHLVLHGMQHRGECALILTSLGHSPGNLDYMNYLRP